MTAALDKADNPSPKPSTLEPYTLLDSPSTSLPSSSLPPLSPPNQFLLKPVPSPVLPKSTKSLNKLLGSSPAKLRPPPPLLDNDIKEMFIRGSGAGGQAINKLATNVSLVHLPTGIRVTYQETRDLQTNRRGARKALQAKLAALNPDGSALPSREEVLAAKAKLKKERAKKRSAKKYGKEKEDEKEKVEAIAPPDESSAAGGDISGTADGKV